MYGEAAKLGKPHWAHGGREAQLLSHVSARGTGKKIISPQRTWEGRRLDTGGKLRPRQVWLTQGFSLVQVVPLRQDKDLLGQASHCQGFGLCTAAACLSVWRLSEGSRTQQRKVQDSQ